jgi:cytochrome c biogenesis protein CcmG, thiol:disulfide interchange protein DsbE
MVRTLVILYLLSTISSFTEAQDITAIQSKRIPDVLISDIKGNPYQTQNISNDGKPFVVVFWKTCCKPPLKELSALNDLYEEWKEKTGVKIYAVSIDDARSSKTVKPFVDGQGWEFEVLLDPNQEFKRSMNVYGVPHTFVFNGQGDVVGQKVLFSQGDEEDIFNMIRQALPNR